PSKARATATTGRKRSIRTGKTEHSARTIGALSRWEDALVRVLLAGLLAAGLAVPSAEAQYFGRNKVRYEAFAFQILQTEHFDLYYYPEEQEAAQLAARMAERWYTRLSQVFRHQLRRRQPIILYASHPHFVQTNAIPGELSEGTGGVTEVLKRRV